MNFLGHELSGCEFTVGKHLVHVFQIVFREDFTEDLRCLPNIQYPVGFEVKVVASKFNIARIGRTVLMEWFSEMFEPNKLSAFLDLMTYHSPGRAK